MTKERYHQLGAIILDSCIAVHKELGPGLLESVYTFALLKEFELRQIKASAKTGLPLLYKGYETGKHYEMDILVEGEIIIEIKSVEVMHPVFMAQIISYLKLSGKKLGYLVNFNVPKMTDGFKRVVNNF
jgi:GxxExxY protein